MAAGRWCKWEYVGVPPTVVVRGLDVLLASGTLVGEFWSHGLTRERT